MNELKPSDFSNAGIPCCSIWGKTETEYLAWAYVACMARNGDEWKPVTAQQVMDCLSDEERRQVGVWEIKEVIEGRPRPRWDSVIDQIKDAESAEAVGGFWRRYHVEKATKEKP